MVDETQNHDTTAATAASEAASTPTGTETISVPKGYVPQEDVNKIVGGAKSEAYERGRRDAQMELDRIKREAASQRLASDSMESADTEKLLMTPEQVQQMMQEAVVRDKQAAEANQFIDKIRLGAEAKKYDDFNEVITQLNLPELPLNLVGLANSLDNTADVMYEIGKNPSKFANILMLNGTSPALAKKELVKLSASIKQNEVAKAAEAQNGKVAKPLDQLKHSISGVDSGKPESVSDYRKQPWLRG